MEENQRKNKFNDMDIINKENGNILDAFKKIGNETMIPHTIIAHIAESRPDKTKQSIKRLSDSGKIQLTPMGEVNHRGQQVEVYYLNKLDSMTAIAQLSPEFTAELVKRWDELEKSQQPKLPSNYVEALEDLLASKKAEQKALDYADKKDQECKVVRSVLSNFKKDKKSYVMRKTFKGFFSSFAREGEKLTESKFKDILYKIGIKVKNECMPTSEALKNNWAKVVKDQSKGFSKMLINPKGREKIAKKLAKEGWEHVNSGDLFEFGIN